MKHRKLRIAWSVFWGLAAVLLIVLWVRSYGPTQEFQTAGCWCRSIRGVFVVCRFKIPTPSISSTTAAMFLTFDSVELVPVVGVLGFECNTQARYGACNFPMYSSRFLGIAM